MRDCGALSLGTGWCERCARFWQPKIKKKIRLEKKKKKKMLELYIFCFNSITNRQNN